ncbi:MAG: hypothetical protein LBB47_02420, partial [Spirochaetaceae bacterium]|nr:hypothetical protein [Spirochaetaceae bacterium]
MTDIKLVSNRNNAEASLSADKMDKTKPAGSAAPPAAVKAQAAQQSASKYGIQTLHHNSAPAAPKQAAVPPAQNQLRQQLQIKSMAPFHSSIFPVLCINNQFKIIYANPSSRKFFTGFFSLDGNLFFDVFGKYFQIEDVKAIRAAILQGVNGFSWRGIAHIKSREHPTVFTRVYIFPAQMDIKEPLDFTVMFDDVTDENKRLLRSIFMSLLEASKLKDNDTGKHISRVNY